jgi:filamentous hemagglutinin family protein
MTRTKAIVRQVVAALLALPAAALAQPIVANGLGTTASATGSAWTIAGGTQLGGNLFHSFGRFGVVTGGSATFTGPGSVLNIIGRVTGGEASSIDGTLRSSIPGADLWLFNPAGIAFGPNATLDVQGSFHASSAHFLTLGDGSVFNARDPGASVLTSAPPSAFGFVDAARAAVTVNGSYLAATSRSPAAI